MGSKLGIKMGTVWGVTLIVTGLISVVFSSVALAAEDTGESLSADAPTALENQPNPNGRFLSLLHAANIAEIESANFAKAKASGKAVRTFAKRLVNDHTKSDHHVTGLALREGFALADAHLINEQDKDQTARLQNLRMLSGINFDRAFVSAMQEAHQRVIERVTEMLPKLTDANCKNLAWSVLPELRKHSKMGADLAKTILAE